MDFFTVYQHDYLWPPRPPAFPRAELTCSIAGPVRDPATAGDERRKACGCCCDGSDDDDGEVEAERSRVVIKKCPKNVKIEYVGEEDECLAKLLKKPRKSDALKKYNQERLTSTYQADFDHLGIIQTKALYSDKPPIPTCPTTATSSKSPSKGTIDCRNPIRSHRELMRQRRGGRPPEESVPPCHDRSGRMSLRKRRRAAAPPEYEQNVLPIWSSEYRDAIGKVGAEILVEGKLSRRAKNRRKMRMAIRGGVDDGTFRTSTRTDKYRKPPATTAYLPPIPPPVKQEYAPADEPEYASDNDYKASGDPETDDSLSLGDANAAADANGDVEQQYRGYADDAKRERLMKSVIYAAYPKPKRTAAYVTEAYDDYAYQATTNVPRKPPPDYATRKVPAYEPSSQAHQRLQQLRELQHRRDFTEKYYAQEIRRLIAEQNNVDPKPVTRNTAGPTATLPPETRSGSYVAERPATAAAASNDLEACGTMTTITRLDCGCVEQTIRPIFTTADGRVQRRTCAQGQQVHMQLSAPSARLVNAHPRIRSKSFGEPRSNSAAAAVAAGQEAAGPATRAASPVRKMSESSVNSM